jgi:calcineurin-like phosphoesterase family protein
MAEIFFTSDNHFGHAKIIEYCDQPFGSVDEMDEAMIASWNQLVKPKDLVYDLGDVFWWFMPFDRVEIIFKRLNGHKHLIVGNHDVPKVYSRLGWAWVKPVHLLNVGAKQMIWLSHYAHRTWPKSGSGSWHLFGHAHGVLKPWGLSCDAGVDSWGFAPVSLETIRPVMAKLDAQAKVARQKRWQGADFLKI